MVVLALALTGGAMPVRAAEIEGVRVPDQVRLDDGAAALVLNGAGVRTRLIFKVYVGALYLQQKRVSADAVLADAGARRVALHMLRDLTAEQLFSALLRIWLGGRPADADLKKAMLGG
jgi:hypothetical protein